MAIEQVTRRICDLNSSHIATRDIKVGLEGKWALLDVCDACHEKATAAVGKFFECGRAPNQKPQIIKKFYGPNGEIEQDADTPADSAPAEDPDREADLRAKVRAWATKTGVKVSVRGRIGKPVYDAFYQAHPELAPAT